MIEALGVPHTEVELILVNGESVGFDRRLREGERVAVYPKFEAFDVTPLLRVREQPLRNPKFIADAHLGALARRLRMAGFDTLYDNHYQDREIADIAVREGRKMCIRDRDNAPPSGSIRRPARSGVLAPVPSSPAFAR